VAVSGPLVLASPCVSDAGLLCVLDGRITNAAELSRSLGLPTNDPHAVIASAYRSFEDALPSRLRGEFALLVWDEHEHRGLIARDRLGARPLFLYDDGRRLYFASEVRTLLALLPRRPGPDAASVVHWFVGSSPRGARTMYEGISALAPGHQMCLAGERWVQRRYWAPEYAGTLDLPRDELVGRLRAELGASVRRALDQDEAAGILLSGGLDSASVAGVAAGDPGGRPLSAYSAVFPRHPSTDESDLIELLTAELRLPAVRIEVLEASMVGGALDYVSEWQLPLMDQNNVLMQPLLRRAAEDGVTAILDGEGGDELFGAARGLIADRVRRGRLMSAVRQTARLPGAGDRAPLRPLASLLLAHGVRGALPARLHRALRRARGARSAAPTWFRRPSAHLLLETDASLDWKRFPGPRWWAQIAYSLTRGLAARGVLEQAGRRAAMAGLDARHPLLDPDLLEFMLLIPPELSFDPHRGRPMLRAGVAGLIPDQVRLRPQKSYFDAPFFEAMAGHDRETVRRLVLARDAEVGAYVDLDAVRSDLLDVSPKEHPMGMRFWTASAWRLATAEIWLRSQRDPDFPERARATWALTPARYRIVARGPVGT
jgi:asparagine synthase (glutamine-hydrolysing)